MSIEEIWKPIPGHRWYEVSNLGRVRSLDHDVRCRFDKIRTVRGRVLRQKTDRTGYFSVALSLGYKKSNRSVFRHAQVHRLMCEAFYGLQPFKGAQSAHGNGIRIDNRIENLRWASAAENAADRSAHGNWHPPRGAEHHAAKLNAAMVVEIRAARANGERNADIARRYGVSEGTASGAYTGNRLWRHVT